MTVVQMRLELFAVPVSDVDRAKAFYVEQAGFNADHDHTVSDEIRFVQLTPPGLGVLDRDRQGRHADGARLRGGAAGGRRGHRGGARRPRRSAASRLSEVQDFPWGRFVFFSDPDGNGWAVQEVSVPG